MGEVRKGTPEEDAEVLANWRQKIIVPHFPPKPKAKPETTKGEDE